MCSCLLTGGVVLVCDDMIVDDERGKTNEEKGAAGMYAGNTCLDGIHFIGQ